MISVHGDHNVPQIWLTYDELAQLMRCDRDEARGAAATIPLDRRKCHDGHTRAKLTPSLTDAFFDGILQRRLEQQLNRDAGELRDVLERMAGNAGTLGSPLRTAGIR
jgi:hypothetical protein